MLFNDLFLDGRNKLQLTFLYFFGINSLQVPISISSRTIHTSRQSPANRSRRVVILHRPNDDHQTKQEKNPVAETKHHRL